jgi:uncharacterized phage-associated protein
MLETLNHHMPRLHFDFDTEKLVHTLAFISFSRGVSGLDKLKILKLLYLADKRHLLETGRPILGDRYSCMPYGPVPSQTYNIINDVMAGDPDMRPANETAFAEYFDIDRSPTHATLVGKKAPDLDLFTPFELSILDEVIDTYGAKSGVQLSDMLHKDPIWTTSAKKLPHPKSSVEIPWELFFEANGASDMLAFALAKQDDRDFDSALAYEYGAN